MFGFYIYKNINRNILNQFHINDQTFEYENYLFYYKKFEKFSEDKLFSKSNSAICGLDGVILNKKHLLEKYSKSNFQLFFEEQFSKQGLSFINELKGEFSGFYFNIEKEILYYFVNKTATKTVFYYHSLQSLIIAPKVNHIIKIKENINIINHLNIEAAYQLLTFGAVLSQQTLVTDVFKLQAGSSIVFNDDKFKIEKYYDYNQIKQGIVSKKDAIQKLNETFINALQLEYEKDIENDFEHIATLSGGLDSRMNVVLATKMNYKVDTFCFSQSQYLDHLISNKIANKYNLNYNFIDLDNGNYLLEIEPTLKINDGLQYYLGSLHYQYSLQKIDLSKYGLIHTGQIGDGLLGGFVSFNGEKSFLAKSISNRFIDKTKSIIQSYKYYRDEEVFKLYHRVFNLTNLGSYVTEHFKTYLVSPFFDADFIEVALSIDPKLKINEKIYIDWIQQFHPYIADFVWERTHMKPDKHWKTKVALYTVAIKNKLLKYSNQEHKTSMNPLEFWYKNNSLLRDFYQNKFSENIDLLEKNKEFYYDALLYFQEGKVIEKATLLTLLSYISKYNLKV